MRELYRLRRISVRWATCLRGYHGELRVIGFPREPNKMPPSAMQNVTIPKLHVLRTRPSIHSLANCVCDWGSPLEPNKMPPSAMQKVTI